MTDLNRFDVVFQKLTRLQSDDADIVLATETVSQVIEATASVTEELRLLAEVNETQRREEFYSGT